MWWGGAFFLSAALISMAARALAGERLAVLELGAD
jgi:hypothetical protein